MLKNKNIFIIIIISLILMSLVITACSSKEANEDKNDKSSIISEQDKNNINQMAINNNAIINWDSALNDKTENSQQIFSLDVQNILLNHKQKAILFNELTLNDIYKDNNKTFVIFETDYEDPSLFFVLEANQSLEKKLLYDNYDYLDEFAIIVKLSDIKRKSNMNINTLPIDEHNADYYIDSSNVLIIYGELLDTYKTNILSNLKN